MAPKNKLPAPVLNTLSIWKTALFTVLFFFAVCLNSAATVKAEAVLMILLTLCAVFLFYSKLRERVGPVVLALGLVVLMNGVSTLYAVSGKLALYEFLKVLTAFCLAMLLLAITDTQNPGRQAAAILEGCCAIAGLVSIDLLSTHWISTVVLSFLGQFTPDYTGLGLVEEGVRLTSIFMNPNVFAGSIGIGVLLSLGLASSAQYPAKRAVHLICLAVNSLAFVLAFSMGACAMILLAFLTLLLMEKKERRTGLFLLMMETLAVTLIAAFPASATALSGWDGFQPVPLMCTIGSAVLLCALDLLFGKRLAIKLERHGKAILGLSGIALIGVAVFLLAAFRLTGSATLQAGESLRRAAYPDPGSYTITSEASGPLTVMIESQNREDTMMHTSAVLYSGPLAEAAFSVPEDSLVVYFNFTAEEAVQLDSAVFSGENGAGSIPLRYKLLPGFIANRCQGLFANQNAIQRLVFFEDGLKLFRRSPVIGLGLGSFANGVRSVQSFYYETKYAHNHYIQSLSDTGIIGLVLFLGLLAVSGVEIWFARRKGVALAPALGAALVFMAGHGAVEVIFSHYSYLPVAFGVFAAIDLSCKEEFPSPEWAKRKAVKSGVLLGISALLAVYGLLLNNNIRAQSLAYESGNLADLEKAARLDPFEWADHMLSYVIRSADLVEDEAVQRQAQEYAERLTRVDSNVLPVYLAEYYLHTGNTEQAFAMIEKYVDYVAADTSAWQRAFDLLERYERDTEDYRAGVSGVVEQMESWNEQNMGTIVLDEKANSFIARMCS